MAGLAVEIGFNTAAVTDSHARHTVTDCDHLHTQLMARDAGIAEVGHRASEATVVCATDADGLHADHRVAWARMFWLWNLAVAERTGLLKNKCLHR